MNTTYPNISIIIVSLNSERTLPRCLKYIRKQTYPKINEILLVDGGSTDETLSLAKKSSLPIKIIDGGYPQNQEARRAIGILNAKNDICFFIDTDNYIIEKKWLTDMVKPLIDDQSVIASQTLRYAVPKNASLLNRYFGLLGAHDPVAYYLGKSDRLSWAFDDWNLAGKIISTHKNYFVIEFNVNNFPTVGCNGIGFRKSAILKTRWGSPENFFHTDVFFDLNKKGRVRFAIVKNEIFHETADNFKRFFQKRRNYMIEHYQNLFPKRRYKIFDPGNLSDFFKLFIFIIFSLSVVEPLFQSLRGYIKKKDVAWFIHPAVCLGILLVYGQSLIYGIITKLVKRD